MKTSRATKQLLAAGFVVALSLGAFACQQGGMQTAAVGDAASAVYVAPDSLSLMTLMRPCAQSQENSAL